MSAIGADGLLNGVFHRDKEERKSSPLQELIQMKGVRSSIPSASISHVGVHQGFFEPMLSGSSLSQKEKKTKHLGCFDPKSSASNSQPYALYIGKAVAVFAVSVLKKVKASGPFPFKKLTNKQYELLLFVLYS